MKRKYDMLSNKKLGKAVLNEGGNVTVGGHSAEKIDLTQLSTEEYESFKVDIIKLLMEINMIIEKITSHPLFKNINTLKNGGYFSGSSEQFFLRSREEFIPYKTIMGDVDVQVSDKLKMELKEILPTLYGKKINGFTFVGTRFGGDYNSLFIPPPKYIKASKCVQFDLEFVSMGDTGDLTEFDKFNKNSPYVDLKKGLKGLIKGHFLSSLYSTKYEVEGVVFQDKTNVVSKSKNLGTISKYSYGNKGVRRKYIPVLDDKGEQMEHDGLPAYRIVKKIEAGDTVTDLKKIFEQIFEAEYDSKNAELFQSYIGLLQLVKKYWSKDLIDKLYEKWSGQLVKLSNDLGEKGFDAAMGAFHAVFNDTELVIFKDLGLDTQNERKKSNITFGSYITEHTKYYENKMRNNWE